MNIKQKIKTGQKKRFRRKKGSVLFITLGLCIVSVIFFGFAFDIARIMYFKSYTRNLASAMALSIVNECAFAYHDSVNGARVVIVHDAASKPMTGYKGKYFADRNYVKVLYDKNKDGMDKTYHIDYRNDIVLNPYYISGGNVVNKTDKKRFEVGSDGVNGEVEVHITARVDLFFLQGLFQKHKIIRESAIAQPTAYATKSYQKIRDEQKITFEWWEWKADY